jgi:hypothetical protein
MRQLKQRIAMRLYIHPLSSIGVEHYIKHRWEKAGATRVHPFNADAVARIAEYSRGIPRLVNAICDNALMLAYAEHCTTLGREHIAEVARDLDLLDSPGRPIRAALRSPISAPARPATPRPVAAAPRAPAPVKAERKDAMPAVNGHANAVAKNPALTPQVAVSTLETYQDDTAKPSRFRRLAGMLGFSAKPPKDEQSW